jgi:hypothetical protein
MFFELHPNEIGNPDFHSLDQVLPQWFQKRGKKMGFAPLHDHPVSHQWRDEGHNWRPCNPVHGLQGIPSYRTDGHRFAICRDHTRG